MVGRNYQAESASWVIRELGTGRVLFETFQPSLLAKLNTARYEAVPILEYLGSLNRWIRHADSLRKARS